MTHLKKRSMCSVLGVVTAGLLLFSTSLPANAEEGTIVIPTATVEEVPSAAEVRTALVTGQAQVASWEALDERTTEHLAKRYADASSAGLTLDVSAAQAWDVDDSTRLLRLPVAEGQSVVPGVSAVNVFFDGQGKKLDTIEFNFVPVSATSGEVRTWLNGDLISNQLAEAPVADESATDDGMATAGYTKGDWWGNFLQCMNSAGAAGWLVTAITIACAAICVVTLGAGCVVCIAGAAGTTGGVVGACITIANNNT